MSVIFSLQLKNSLDTSLRELNTADNGIYMQGTNGKAVILIHGMTGTPHEMRYIAAYLNKNGYTVSVPRLAKHGAPIHILKHARWQEFYATIRANYLQIKETHTEVYTAGLSMGALLAVLLAEEFKLDIRAVSCLAPTLFYDGWNCPWYRCLLPLSYITGLKYFFFFKEEHPYGVKNRAIQRLIHEFYAKARLEDMASVAQFGYPYFPVSLLHQLEKLVVHLTPRLSSVISPIQLIHAKEDDMASLKNSQFIYDRAASPVKELVVLENSYHIITADQERETVARKMTDFFNARQDAVHA